MSLRGVAPLLRRLGLSAILMLAAPAWTWAQPAGCASGACFGTPTALGGSCGSCGSFCQTHHCPPAYVHCLEGPPCIRWKCGCPRPVCNPCELPHWGYYDKCWTPWPFPPNWTHCPTLPPAATVTLNPQVHPSVQQQQPAPPGMQPPCLRGQETSDRLRRRLRATTAPPSPAAASRKSCRNRNATIRRVRRSDMIAACGIAVNKFSFVVLL